MTAEIAQMLATVTLASSAALLLVFALRKPLRAIAGARAAYTLWLLVPALVVAALLPAPTQGFIVDSTALPAQLGAALRIDVGAPAPDRAGSLTLLVAVWALGAAAMLVALVRRQRVFTRSFGTLTRTGDGVFRSAKVTAPMLVGVWRPRVIVPDDFESRYSDDERELVLAHERAHARRGDVAVNALAALGLCVCWFNPLAYVALACLRMDQELACDAVVLARRSDARRRYAGALLKTQLATDAAWRAPIGCRWQSSHPLKERIAMLRNPMPGALRRLGGITLIAALTGAVSYAAWAGQPAASEGPPILVDYKITISNPQTNEVRALNSLYVVHSGEEIKDDKGQPLEFSCTPWLPDAVEKSAAWKQLYAQGIRMRADQVLLECALRRDGAVIEQPVLLIGDGEWGTIEMTERGGPRQFKIAVRPSTSATDIAAAKSAKPG